MGYENLPDELKKKAAECETADELLALAAREGVELTDDQLEAVSGGVDWDAGFEAMAH